MPSLSETQAAFREAVTGAPPEALLARLRAPADPVLRLDIYRRHHRESFRRHLRGRYPTLEWLLGTEPPRGTRRCNAPPVTTTRAQPRRIRARAR